jgi:cyclophilin family peptidyl-prolyl cis-trans isomerase
MDRKNESFYLFVGLISGFILFFGLVFGLSIYAGSDEQDLNDLNDLNTEEEQEQTDETNEGDTPGEESPTEEGEQPAEDENTEAQEITVPPEIAEKNTVQIVTEVDGEQLPLVIELDQEAAPRFVNNFKNKVNEGFYSDLRWHRSESVVLQGGDPLSSDEANQELWGTGGDSISAEGQYSDREFTRGAVGIPRASDKSVSNSAQIFITKEDFPAWNGEYVYIGRVVEGMENVDQMGVGDLIVSAEFTD